MLTYIYCITPDSRILQRKIHRKHHSLQAGSCTHSRSIGDAHDRSWNCKFRSSSIATTHNCVLVLQDHGTDGHVCACPKCPVYIPEPSSKPTRLTSASGYVLRTPSLRAWVLTTTCSQIQVRSRLNSTNGNMTISASSNPH